MLLGSLLASVGFAPGAVVPADFTSPSSVPVKAASYVAAGNRLKLTLGWAPPAGTALMVVQVTGKEPITGEFANIKQGQRVKLEHAGFTYRFLPNYRGGDGNDLVLEWAYQNVHSWGSNEQGQLTGSRDSWVPTKASLAGMRVTRIAAGGAHSLALLADGSLIAWGDNTYGQLGDGTLGDFRTKPVRVVATGALAGKTVIDVAAGTSHSLALCLDGTVVCWGRNQGGQLGDGTYTDRNVPVAMFISGALTGKSLTVIAAGGARSSAIRSDGKVVEWGNFYPDTIGNGQVLVIKPKAVVRATGALAGKTAVALAVGKSHSLALCSDNTVVAWGDNQGGQLGIAADFASSIEPVPVYNEGILARRKIVAVAAGEMHSLVLLSDGKVAAWGWNNTGQLGIDTITVSRVPVEVNSAGVLAGKTVVTVAAGSFHNLALCSDGTLAAWGYGGFGELGNGTVEPAYVPVALGTAGDLSDKKVFRLAAGSRHSLALAAAPLSNDSSLAALDLGVSAVNYAFSPGMKEYVASVPKGTSSLTITPVARHWTARISVNGTEVASGAASLPVALAAGETLIPVKVTTEDGTSTTYSITVLRPADVSCVFQSTTDTAVSAPAFDATGLNAELSLAFAPPNGTSLTVVDNTGLNFITGEFSNLVHGQVVSLAYQGVVHKFVANYHGGTGNDLVLEWFYRKLVSWGNNTSGELGIGSNALAKLPRAVTETGVLAGKLVLTVAAGAGHNLALCSDGTLAAWGRNGSGQLGNGETSNKTLPVEVERTGVLSGKRVVAIAAGAAYSLVLCSDGTLAAWGAVTNGQPGNAGGSGSSVPVPVDQTGALAGKRVVAITAGYNSSLALCSDGTVATWGNDQLGQTGVLSGRIVTAIASGDYHHLALCSDGTLATWGWYSGFGEGTQNPVVVDQTGILSGKTVVSVEAGGSLSLCLCSDGTLAAWGSNASGQLGNGGNSNSTLPVAVTRTGIFSGKSISRISAGGIHGLASCADGTVAAWGGNSTGQLGDGSTTNRRSPIAVDGSGVLADRNVVGLSAGNSHSVAIAAESPSSALSALTLSPGGLSSAFAPGTLAYTAVAAAGSSFTVTPVTREASATVKVNNVTVASGSSSSPIDVSAAGSVEIVVTADNGATTTYVISMPADIATVFSSSSDVPVTSAGYSAAGWSAGLSLGFSPPLGTNLTVIKNSGASFITGQFTNLAQGQLVELSFDGTTYHFVANYYGGTGNDLVLEWANRGIVGWGWNSSGQLGIAPSSGILLPFAMPDMGVLAGKTIVSIAAGASHSLALCSDGTLVSWGGGASNLGAGGTTQSSVPIAVKTTGALAGKRVVVISAAAANNLAVCADGSMVAWGHGFYGQLGNGGTVPANEPVTVSLTGALAGKSVTSVAVGGTFSLALCSDGSVLAWGDNRYGQLGDGTFTDRNVPVAVSTAGVLAGKQVVAISAGLLYSLALCSDGTLVAWGDDSSRQLGSSAFQGNSSTPKLVDRTGVLAGETVIALSQAAHSTPTVLCASGKVVTWGLNDRGQRGNLSLPAWRPDYVTSSGALAQRQVVGVSSGGFSSMAICSDGGVVTWGDNFYGQLGVPGLTSSFTPVAVSGEAVLTGNRALFGAVASHCLLVIAQPDR